MKIRLTNSLTRKKEEFAPRLPNKVQMYVCGPTVYGLTHIGNARPVVFFNVVRSFLEFAGFEVTYVSNFTDVDDKIINRAREEKVSASELAQKYVDEFKKDMASLDIRPPDKAPRVTEVIPQIVTFVEGLIKNGKAYATESGEVFYAVRSFEGYGKLSGKNIDDLLAGARVEPGAEKKDPLDFSLWKPQKAADEPSWDSPWGRGRPGWHIECSAMAMEVFGESFDIHGGGMDLIHPHHENEIAQSEGLTGKPFVKYWMHNNMLTMGSEKMSKSVGNIFLTRDFIKAHSSETLKYLLLSGHYRSTIDFSEKNIQDVESALHRFYSTKLKCEKLIQQEVGEAAQNSSEQNQLEKVQNEFSACWKEAMADDFNTAKAIGFVFEYVRKLNAFTDRKKFVFDDKAKGLLESFLSGVSELSQVLGVLGAKSEAFLGGLRERYLSKNGLSEEEVESLIQERLAARKSKDFARSDAIRDELAAKGVLLKDGADKTEWDIQFS